MVWSATQPATAMKHASSSTLGAYA